MDMLFDGLNLASSLYKPQMMHVLNIYRKKYVDESLTYVARELQNFLDSNPKQHKDEIISRFCYNVDYEPFEKKFHLLKQNWTNIFDLDLEAIMLAAYSTFVSCTKFVFDEENIPIEISLLLKLLKSYEIVFVDIKSRVFDMKNQGQVNGIEEAWKKYKKIVEQIYCEDPIFENIPFVLNIPSLTDYSSSSVETIFNTFLYLNESKKIILEHYQTASEQFIASKLACEVISYISKTINYLSSSILACNADNIDDFLEDFVFKDFACLFSKDGLADADYGNDRLVALNKTIARELDHQHPSLSYFEVDKVQVKDLEKSMSKINISETNGKQSSQLENEILKDFNVLIHDLNECIKEIALFRYSKSALNYLENIEQMVINKEIKHLPTNSFATSQIKDICFIEFMADWKDLVVSYVSQ